MCVEKEIAGDDGDGDGELETDGGVDSFRSFERCMGTICTLMCASVSVQNFVCV